MSVPLLLTSVALAGPPDTAGLATGRYVMTLHSATRARVPVFGWTPSVTVSDVIVDLTETEGGLQVRHEVCTVRIAGDRKRARIIIPPAFVASLPIKQYAASVSPSSDGLRFVADLGTNHVGYDPEATSVVPQRPEDVGVVDQDADGNPGVTVLLSVPIVGEASLYVVQRARMRLIGTLQPDGTVAGRIDLQEFDQFTLDATHWMLRGSPEIEPIPGDSWFAMRSAPGASCDGLRAD